MTPDSLPESLLRRSDASVSPTSGELIPLHVLIDRYIEQVLRHTGGNYTRAASILGISRQSLIERLKRIASRGSLSST